MTPNTAPARPRRRGGSPSYIAVAVLLILAGAIYLATTLLYPEAPEEAANPPDKETGTIAQEGSGDEPQLVSMEKALEARGVYLTYRAACTPSKMSQILGFVRKSPGINALVIDLKDNTGSVPLPAPEGVPSRPDSYRQFPGLIQVLKDEGYYLIARVVVFQDPYIAEKMPDRAIRNADGSLWRDNDGRFWLNPYDKRNWELSRNIALWAWELGFDEVQLDYVRFPDGARGLESGKVLLPGKEEFASRGECITQFLQYMRQELESKVYLSADIFGFTTIAVDDMGIGQKIEEIADCVDFICPMIYPSHYYNRGIYGFEVPEAHPEEVVYKAMEQAIERTKGLRAKIRPWLQDFSMRVSYGPAEIQAQIDATYAHGVRTFLMWNPSNVYTEGVDYEGGS